MAGTVTVRSSENHRAEDQRLRSLLGNATQGSSRSIQRKGLEWVEPQSAGTRWCWQLCEILSDSICHQDLATMMFSKSSRKMETSEENSS